MTQAKQDKRPAPQPKAQQVRRQRKPHPTQGWFTLAQRASIKEKQA